MKYFKTLLMSALLIYANNAIAQTNLQTVEYFLDNDPGYGNGTTITVPANTTNYANQIINIDPALIANGIHTVYIRSKNADGSWSHTNRLLFNKPENNGVAPALANLQTVEYFLDNDPGYGNGTTITVPANTTDYANQIINIDPALIANGIHTLYIRSKNADGSWSHTNRLLFNKPENNGVAPALANLQTVEYFIDNDPGYGNGTTITVPANTTNFANQILNIDPATITEGIHVFYIRSKDANGSWSHTNKLLFFKPSPPSVNDLITKIKYAEYFFDTDPGYYKASPIAISPSTDISNFLLSTNITGLAAGSHRFYIRGIDSIGKWSHTDSLAFNIGTASPAPSIVVNSINKFVMCARDSFNIGYQATGTYNAGNTFTVQLSDANGSFASPIVIGTKNSIALSDTIGCKLPAHINGGIGFLVRVISSNTALTGIANTQMLTIRDRPFAQTIAGLTEVNGTFTHPYSIPNVATSNYTWLATGGTFTTGTPASSGNMAWAQPTGSNAIGLLKVVETNQFGCVGDTSALSINVYRLRINNIPDNLTPCKAFSINIATSIDGAITAGNVYTAQLSDATGSFTSPVNIGTLTANGNGINQPVTINANIPANTPNGTMYRIRIVSNNPAFTGAINSMPITITKPDIGVDLARSKCLGFTYNLAADFTDAALTYQFFDNNFAPVNANVNAGTFNVVGTNVNGCKDTAQVVVTNFPKPNIGADITRSKCVGFTYNLAIDFTDATLTYQYFDNNFVIVNNNVNTGLYNVVATNSNGCKDTAQVTVTNFPKPNIGVDIARSKCIGFTYNLAVNFTDAALTYQYFDNNFVLVNNNVNTGLYNVVATNSNGCKDTAQVTVTNFPKPNLGADIARSKCVGFTYNLASDFLNDAFTYQFFDNNFITTNSNVNTGLFNVVATNDNGCKDTVQVTVTNFAKPNIGADLSRSKCVGFTYNLATDFTNAALTYQYFDNNFVTTSNNVNIGLYNVVATNSSGCKDTAQVTVTNFAQPNTSAIVADNNFNVGYSNPFSVTNTTGSTYVWEFSNGTQNTGGNSNSVTATFNTPGTQTIKVTETNANGCVGTAVTINVNVLGIAATNVANGFPVCATGSVSVNYNITGNYKTGNVFTVLLSNATGSFTNATSIGTLSLDGILNNITGVIACSIPTNTPAGSAYRTKIVASMPVFEGLVNTTNLTITAASNTFTLTSDVTVNGNLNLSNPPTSTFPCFAGGKIILGNFNLRVNGAITGFDNSHFIVTNGSGSLCINNTASQNNIYPVANNSNGTNFLQINNTGTPDVFCVNLQPQVLKNGTSGPTVNSGVVKNTWNITEGTIGGSNASITVFWSLADELPDFNRNSCYISHYNGSFYDVQGNGTAMGSNPYSIVRNNVTDFSPFVVTSMASVLPISLLNFSGKIVNDISLLNWQTSNETNSKNFVVQRSINGINFTNIASINASGYATTIKSYSYNDDLSNVAGTAFYYRLQQYDADGKFIYSPIVLLKKTSKANSISIYPNPVYTTLHANAHFDQTGTAMVNILSIDGKAIIQKNMAVQKGNNIISINVNTLPSGIYYIKINNETNSYIQKFVKEK